MKHTTHVQANTRQPAPAAIVLSGLLLLATLALLALTSGASPLSAHTGAQLVEQRAILGRIDYVERFGSGLTVVTVQDRDGGQVELEVMDELTVVVVPGLERSLAEDLPLNSTIAALALERIGVTNVNTASDAELQRLPQIGPARSQAIVNFRTANGFFNSVNDLQQVPGITQGIWIP